MYLYVAKPSYSIVKRKYMKGRIEINQELCKGCELCISFCPKKLISLSDTLNAAGYLPSVFNDAGECTGCATCAVVCPEVAIEVYRG
jgi:2-oxoglutarate ferredoxin oxidoreductase subunit delta